jgi:hypothetical protein
MPKFSQDSYSLAFDILEGESQVHPESISGAMKVPPVCYANSMETSKG